MLMHGYSLRECNEDRRFWLMWVVTTTCLATIGYSVGIAIAFVYGVGIAIAVPLGFVGRSVIMLLPAAAIVGAFVGASAGHAQSMMLPGWSTEQAQRWQRRSRVGWTLGAVNGLVAAIAVFTALDSPISIDQTDTVVAGFVLSTAFGGIVIGLALWPALPKPAPNIALWSVLTAVAVSLGWLAAWLLARSGQFDASPWALAVLGPLVYAMISGAMMVWVERRRLSAPGHTPGRS
jgi:hypothetical protein